VGSPIDFDAQLASVWTPYRSHHKVTARARGGVLEILDYRTLTPLERVDMEHATFVCGRGQCGDPNILARWQVTARDGSRFLVEWTAGCACGGSYEGTPMLERLDW
jgi:hypothetical protein